MTSGSAIQWALVIGVVVTWILSLWAKKQPEERAWVSLLIFIMATLVTGHVERGGEPIAGWTFWRSRR